MKVKVEYIYDGDSDTVEILKQEIINEDTDWNLFDEAMYNEGISNKVSDVKKCRDLIIEDMYKCFKNGLVTKSNLIKIINERFGDL